MDSSNFAAASADSVPAGAQGASPLEAAPRRLGPRDAPALPVFFERLSGPRASVASGASGLGESCAPDRAGAVNLLGLDDEKLLEFVQGMGEKTFRARQLMRWIHQSGCDDFAAMTDLAKAFRAKLEGVARVRAPALLREQGSRDGTRKWLLDMGGGNAVETVYIPEQDRGTLCVSSQIGCALECRFCATGRQGFNRNLSAAEIIGQLWWAHKRLDSTPKQERKISNVVLMGMGEPLANYANVVTACRLMLDDNGYKMSRRRVTVSTSGMVPQINRLARDCPVALAVSLHAPNDEIRDRLVPLNKKYPMRELLSACLRYLEFAPRNFITFEYVLLSGVNDRPEHMRELLRAVRGVPCKFNLIPFNDFEGSGFKTPSDDAVDFCRKFLLDNGIMTTVRRARGDDIDAACGQLAGKVKDKTGRAAAKAQAPFGAAS